MQDMRDTISRCGRLPVYLYLVAIASLLLASMGLQGQQDAPMARAPRDWVVDAANNEIEMLKDDGVYLRYRMHVVDRRGDQTRDVIESKEGTVARTVLRDGKPLTADEDKMEQERLEAILTSPDRFEKHRKSDISDRKMATDLIKLMPDAMVYTYVPGQPQTAGYNEGEGVVVLDYHPNPKWNPPTTISQALTGLEGRMWIDVRSHRMVRMEGHIFKPVNFGWGMLARLFPGGQLALEQTHVAGNRWIYTSFTEQLNVRALMVKSMDIHSQVETSHFEVLPEPMSYQDAVRKLLATPLPIH